MKNERRYRIIYAPVNTLVAILHGRVRVVDFDLPSDVRVVHVAYDLQRDALALIVESADFEPVPLGCEIPPLYAMGFTLEMI